MRTIIAILAIFLLTLPFRGYATEEGIVIKARPVIYVTMMTNHVYTLYHTDDLTKAWEPMFGMMNMVVTNTNKRLVIEWDEDRPVGFFKLEKDGKFIETVITNAKAIISSPPIP